MRFVPSNCRQLNLSSSKGQRLTRLAPIRAPVLSAAMLNQQSSGDLNILAFLRCPTTAVMSAVDVETNQFRREVRESLGPTIGRPIFDDEVLPFDVTEIMVFTLDDLSMVGAANSQRGFRRP
jgi:hypothetical protein